MKMIKYRSSRSGSDSSTDCDAVLCFHATVRNMMEESEKQSVVPLCSLVPRLVIFHCNLVIFAKYIFEKVWLFFF